MQKLDDLQNALRVTNCVHLQANALDDTMRPQAHERRNMHAEWTARGQKMDCMGKLFTRASLLRSPAHLGGAHAHALGSFCAEC